MKKYLIGIICLLSTEFLIAQCGTVMDDVMPSKKYSQKTSANYSKADVCPIGALRQIPVKATIFHSGSDISTTRESFMNGLKEANNLFRPEGIEFFLCQDIRIIDDWQYYNIRYDLEEESLGLAYDQGTEFLNLYICNDLSNSKGKLNGLFDTVNKRLVFAGNVFDKSNNIYRTLAHEFGHVLGLPHTYKIGVDEDREDPTRVFSSDCHNCAVTGDRFCDTPADFDVVNIVLDSTGCRYSNARVGACSGQPYDNSVLTNIMSYGTECRSQFSPEQYNSMRCYFDDNYAGVYTCPCSSTDLTVSHDLNASHIYAAPRIYLNKDIALDANVTFKANFIHLLPETNAIGKSLYAVDHGCSVNKFNDSNNNSLGDNTANINRNATLETLDREYATTIFPNPTQSKINIRFYLPKEVQTFDLSVYNLDGQLLTSILMNQNLTPGWQEVIWDLTNSKGQKLDPGIYLIRILKEDELETKKIVITR